uniref:ISAzo13-like element transposase-related protein n=1 Tax=Bacteroides fragilis TaxID=817 RepID=UPI0021CD8160|nr:hypothetical protein [Bacteroides fragilis]
MVRQVLDLLAFHHCSFIKDMPMKEVKDRDAQFKNISSIRTACWKIRFPMISIDTKKKELIGKFKRNGKVLIKTQQKSLDYDFAIFSNGQIIPHGIYDATGNVEYVTISTSHDASKFVCDNIHNVFKNSIIRSICS